MKKKIVKQQFIRIGGILPFTEKPSNSHFDVKEHNENNPNNPIQACDLFSLFTADIIKEQVTFTR
jgi:hypothetical protein